MSKHVIKSSKYLTEVLLTEVLLRQNFCEVCKRLVLKSFKKESLFVKQAVLLQPENTPVASYCKMHTNRVQPTVDHMLRVSRLLCAKDGGGTRTSDEVHTTHPPSTTPSLMAEDASS